MRSFQRFFLLGKKGEKFKRGRKTEVTIITDTKKYNQKILAAEINSTF